MFSMKVTMSASIHLLFYLFGSDWKDRHKQINGTKQTYRVLGSIKVHSKALGMGRRLDRQVFRKV